MITKEKIQGFDVLEIRKDFPILDSKMNSNPLVYFDNGATTQKPESVIKTLEKYYRAENANVHRGVYHLSQVATDLYDGARKMIAKYLGAEEAETVIFTSGTTDSINLVAQTWARQNLAKGDEVLITGMEHHSNIVPWQMVCEEKQAVFKIIPLNDDGSLNMEAFEDLLSGRTKLVAVAHVSNTLGIINPVEEIIVKSHCAGARVLIDGAQALPHFRVDIKKLDCDFYAFSGHKMFGPTGTGVLYGKREVLESMPPWKGGGDMIERVTFEKTTYAPLPFKFEAGTPNIAGVTGLGAATNYLTELDADAIVKYEGELLEYLTEKLMEIDGMRIFGTARPKVAVVSFLVGGLHPYDIGTLLDQMGIAVRTGHHCTQPLMDRYCIPGTVRASLAFYNTHEEIDVFVNALNRALKMLR